MMLGTGFSIPSLAVRRQAQTARSFSLLETLPAGAAFSRTSPAVLRNASGVFVSVASKQPRFDHDETGNPIGLLLENSALNISPTVNIDPVTTTGISVIGSALLSVVNDAAALTAAKLSDLCTNGQVYKFDGTSAAGNSFAVIGKTISGSEQTLSAWVRGDGLVAIMGESTFAFSHASYARVSGTHRSTSDRNVAMRVNPGQVCYFILQQLENGAHPSSEILSGMTSATARAADSLTLPIPDGTHDVVMTYQDEEEVVFSAQTVSGGWNVPVPSSGKRIRQVRWS